MYEGSHKFGIILPVRNGGEYVKLCVKSILTQTLPAFDLHVLDNNSTDGTVEWIRSLNDSRIHIYSSSKDLSIEENWGRIISISKNEFITLIGHDDLLHENYLAEMDKLIIKFSDASLYQSHFRYIDINGVFIRPCKPMVEVQHAHEFLDAQILQTLDSMGSGYMMRSKDYDALGGIPVHYPKLIFADYELWIRLMLKSYKATTPVECFSYRVHNSTSALTNGEEYQEAFGKYMFFLNEMKQRDKNIAKVIEVHGKIIITYYCQSLSHRLLKTPKRLRKTSVGQFIEKCRQYAVMLIPGQSFKPMLKLKILAAYMLDNKIGLKIFSRYKKFYS